MDRDRLARRLDIADLYADYADCLDSDELERWPDFFVETARYRITSAEDHDAGRPGGIIYATSRNMLKDRVSALREANIYEPQRYRHILGTARLVKEMENAVETTANFLILRTVQHGEMTLFAAGRYLDSLRLQDGTWKFVSKLVVLDSRQIDTLLAIPM